MQRAEKGPPGPAPDLEGVVGDVARAVAALPGVAASVHWHLYQPTEIDGADFYRGEAELGHIHLDGWAHVRLTRAARDAALARGIGEPAPWRGYADWLHLHVTDRATAAQALALFCESHAMRQS